MLNSKWQTHLKWKHDLRHLYQRMQYCSIPYLPQSVSTSFKASSQKEGQPELNSPFKSGPCPNCATQDIFKKDAVQQSLRSHCPWFAVLATAFSTNGKNLQILLYLRGHSTHILLSKYLKRLSQQLPPLPRRVTFKHHSWITKSSKEAGHTSWKDI